MSKSRNKIINDAVFGSIELTPICVKIIDTPEFQRLRHLHQLGVASYVYPTATHTRFQHCLGVYHVAKQMMEKLMEKQSKLAKLVENKALIEESDVTCVCIAALCHDLGHGPFSHTWERFMKTANPSINWKHEDTSVDMFKKIWKRLVDLKDASLKMETIDEDRICALIRGEPNKGERKHFLFEIVANKENGVDVDKFAYLAQDSYYLGIKTSFDYARLINMAELCPVLSEEGKTELKLGYKISEELNVYYTFLTRWNLHRRAYRHRVVLMIDRMLVDAFVKAKDEKIIMFKGENKTLSEATPDELDMFINLVDDSLFQRVLELNPTHESRILLERILHRNLYQQAAEKLIQTKQFSETEEVIKNCIAQKLTDKGVNMEELKDDFDIGIESFNFGKKDEDPMEKVRFFTYDDDSMPKIVAPEERPALSSLLTQNFEELLVLLIWKPEKTEKTEKVDNKKKVIEAFNAWHVEWKDRQE